MWLLGCLASSCSQDLRSMLRKILWTRNTLSRGNPPSGTWEIAIAHGRISILTKALFNMKRTLFVTWDSQLLGITFLSTTETPHQPTTGTATPLCCVYLSSNYLCLLWVHWVHCQMQKKKHGHKVNQSLLRTGRSFMRDMLASLWYKKRASFMAHYWLPQSSIHNCSVATPFCSLPACDDGKCQWGKRSSLPLKIRIHGTWPILALTNSHFNSERDMMARFRHVKWTWLG